MLNVLKCLVMQLIWPDNIIKFVILGIKPAPTSFEIPSSHLATELLSPTPESPCCLLAFLGAEPRSPEPIFPCVRWKLPRSLYSSVLKFSFWTYLWPVLTLICNQPHPMSCFFFFFLQESYLSYLIRFPLHQTKFLHSVPVIESCLLCLPLKFFSDLSSITDKICVFQPVYSCSLFGENNSSKYLLFTWIQTLLLVVQIEV